MLQALLRGGLLFLLGKLGDYMQAIGFIVYIVVGLFQLAAIMAGLESWWGLHWIIAAPIAFIVSYIPFVGAIVGIRGLVFNECHRRPGGNPQNAHRSGSRQRQYRCRADNDRQRPELKLPETTKRTVQQMLFSL